MKTFLKGIQHPIKSLAVFEKHASFHRASPISVKFGARLVSKRMVGVYLMRSTPIQRQEVQAGTLRALQLFVLTPRCEGP